ncbi:non-ribosomal peptide synthetase [Pseudomonas sp. NPDC089554]|uniref:non-ribosomal peptide synthetase n=1 Tax=Pseudomonas sp. NPDC089554 TaxID=3390653 RepID=UPI003D06764D
MDTSKTLATRLTPQERAQWLMARMQPQDTRYNIGLAIRIDGDLQRQALHFAWQRLVAGHEILRTTYPGDAGVPVAVCAPGLQAPLSFFDDPGLDDMALKASTDAWFDSPFDLAHGPCLRLGCFARGAGSQVLVLCAHHIIADFTSLGLLLDELEALYLDEIGSEAEHWRDTPMPFGDYRRQVCATADGQPSASQAHWLHYLENAPAPLEWPDHWRQGGSGVASHYLTLDGERLRGVRRWVENTGASLYAVVLATWAVAVSRACAQPQIMVGMPMSMRDSASARTLGSLFNVLPLRVCAQGSLQALIRAIRNDLHRALDHRDFDLGAALETLVLPRPEGRNPLFQTTVNLLGQAEHSRWLALQMAGADAQAGWAGLRAAPWPLAQQQGQVDIALELVDAHERLRCVIKADQRTFSASGLERFAAHWLATVDALMGAQGDVDCAAPAACEADYNSVPGPLNSLPSASAPAPTLVAWFDRQASRYPDAPALRDEAGALDYRGTQARSVKLARHLETLGVVPGDRVGVLLAPGIDALLAMLAVMRAGAAYVPLDPSLPSERLALIVRSSAIAVVVADGQLPLLDELGVRGCQVGACTHDDLTAALPLFDRSTPDTCAYSVFTSGSTGQPKGIDVAQANVVALLASMYHALQMPEQLLWSWSHAASFDLSVWEIWGALCSGGCLLVIPSSVRSRPDVLLEWLIRHQVGVITQTPSGLRQLSADFLQHSSRLVAQHWVVCGEALPGAVARQYLSDRWALWNLYGPAETTVFATLERVTPALADEAIVPIGRPLSLATVYLREGETCPAKGTLGEIVIGGAGVSLGYVGLAQQNRERFIVDPYRQDAIAYRTGDLGYWDGERLRFAGRIDEQVKFNGYRIELGEIERCLEACAEVRQAAVLLEEVDGHMRLVALVSCHDAVAGFDEKALREYLRGKLPGYMQPTRVLPVAQLPLNRHAKLDRKAARHLLETLVPSTAAAVADVDGWRERVVAIWASVLGRPEVGLDDAFFDLGGNSMALLEVHAQLQRWPEAQHLRPSDLFRWVTPRMLANALQGDAVVTAEAAPVGLARRSAALQRRRQLTEANLAEGGRHE